VRWPSVLAAAFVFHAVLQSTGGSPAAIATNFGWPLAALMIATAAWWPTDRKGPRVGPYRTILWPAAFSTLALGVLVYDHFERVNLLALVLATASMVAVVARLTLTFALN